MGSTIKDGRNELVEVLLTRSKCQRKRDIDVMAVFAGHPEKLLLVPLGHFIHDVAAGVFCRAHRRRRTGYPWFKCPYYWDEIVVASCAVPISLRLPTAYYRGFLF